MLASHAPEPSGDVLERLRHLCADRGLEELAANLDSLRELVLLDMEALDTELREISIGGSVAQRAGRQILDLGGQTSAAPLRVAGGARRKPHEPSLVPMGGQRSRRDLPAL